METNSNATPALITHVTISQTVLMNMPNNQTSVHNGLKD